MEKELGYFVRNVEGMQYGTFRSRGFLIGSGVIEAGCKTIIGTRRKQSRASRRLDDFWKARLNAQAAANDCLALAA